MSLASKPPLGWNSFISYGSSINETEFKANVDIFAKKLKPLGWEYVVVDYCWSHPGPSLLEHNPNQYYAYEGMPYPLLAMDAFGRLVPDPLRFPSSANGKGFAPLAEYVHSKGLKFGIHIMRGIPRQAVALNTPIKGSNHTAIEIADTIDCCLWLNHMYGVNMNNSGAQEYYDSLFELYASWNLDFIKVDDLSFPYHSKEIEAVSKSINRCAKQMVLSTSPGATPIEQISHINQYANMWRIAPDSWDEWPMLKRHFDLCAAWAPFSASGHWADADMLPIGPISQKGPYGPPRMTRFTKDEQKSLMTLCGIFRSPLFMGGDLPKSDDFTWSLLTNKDLLALNQSSVNNKQVYRREDIIVWSADSENKEFRYVAVFNVSDSQKSNVEISLKELDISYPCNAYEIWSDSQKIFSTEIVSVEIPMHGALLFKIG